MRKVLKEWESTPEIEMLKRNGKNKKSASKWCKLHKKSNQTTEQCHKLNKSSASYNSFVPQVASFNQSAKYFSLSTRFPMENIIEALVDTGAEIICIGACEAKSLRLLNTEDIRVANGERSTGKWSDFIEVEIKGVTKKIRFLSVEHLTHKLIIGRDLFELLIAKLDLENVFNNRLPATINNVLRDFERVMSDQVTVNSKRHCQNSESIRKS